MGTLVVANEADLHAVESIFHFISSFFKRQGSNEQENDEERRGVRIAEKLAAPIQDVLSPDQLNSLKTGEQ